MEKLDEVRKGNGCLLAQQAVEEALASVDRAVDEVLAEVHGILDEVGVAIAGGPIEHVQADGTHGDGGNFI